MQGIRAERLSQNDLKNLFLSHIERNKALAATHGAQSGLVNPGHVVNPPLRRKTQVETVPDSQFFLGQKALIYFRRRQQSAQVRIAKATSSQPKDASGTRKSGRSRSKPTRYQSDDEIFGELGEHPLKATHSQLPKLLKIKSEFPDDSMEGMMEAFDELDDDLDDEEFPERPYKRFKKDDILDELRFEIPRDDLGAVPSLESRHGILNVPIKIEEGYDMHVEDMSEIAPSVKKKRKAPAKGEKSKAKEKPVKVKEEPKELEMEKEVIEEKEKAVMVGEEFYTREPLPEVKGQWLKYGQKKVKGIVREYFKCYEANCPAKKQVETLAKNDGTVEYHTSFFGQHDHVIPEYSKHSDVIQNQQDYINAIVSAFGDEKEPVTETTASSHNDDGSKKKKRELVRKLEVEVSASLNIAKDGYKWRKYGQKLYKGGSEPRAYFKCCFKGCPARKTVEVAREGVKLCIYQSNHSHPVAYTKADAAGKNESEDS